MAKPSRLPNAPLSEVVFELRWGLPEVAGTPAPFQSDPGYSVLADSFASEAKRAGFAFERVMNPGHVFARAVDRRYYLSKDQNFPILQIGPGIFAANQSAEYTWVDFKKLVTKGISILISSYPKMKTFALRPNYLELRYIDVFEEELIGTIDFVKFLNEATTIEVALPQFLSDKSRFHDATIGRTVFQFDVKGMKDSVFSLDLASGNRENKKILRLESKIVVQGGAVLKAKTSHRDSFVRQLTAWLDQSHSVLSPFFKALVKPTVMEKFQ